MKFPGRFTSGVLLLLSSFAAFAQSELVVKVKPANNALKANVEGYIGSLGDRDEEALLRFARGAQEQALKASQALGYYQPKIESEVKPGDPPRLVLSIDPGEPVRLRNVTVRVEGPAASLKMFQIPTSDGLKPGAVLNQGNYEDAKRLIQNRALRYGFLTVNFSSTNCWSTPRAVLLTSIWCTKAARVFSWAQSNSPGTLRLMKPCCNAWCPLPPARPMTRNWWPSSTRTCNPVAILKP